MPIHKNVFSDKEAWGIYRIAAFGEAIGWTLLIAALGAQKYLMHGNKILVLFAGQIHGLLFFAYIAAVLGTYASLGWSFKKAFLIGLMSVPPYGTLIAEMLLSKLRKIKHESIKTTVRVFAIIQNDKKYLFIEKNEENSWTLPGTVVGNQNIEKTMQNYCRNFLNLKTDKILLQHIRRQQIEKEQYLDFFFKVENTKGTTLLQTIGKNKLFENVRFLNLDDEVLSKKYNFIKKSTHLFL